MAASLPNEPDDLLITDELRHRIAHKADYQREKLAIQDLARQMNAFVVGRVVGRLDKELVQHLLEGFFSRPIGVAMV